MMRSGSDGTSFARWILVVALICGGEAWGVVQQSALLPSEKLGLSLVGIGGVLNAQDGGALVTELVPGGPAAREGHLKVNDLITAVAQGNADFVPCIGLALEKTVEMIRGAKGSTVRLKVTNAAGAQEVITIVRQEINMVTQDEESQLADALKKIGDARRETLAEYTERIIGSVVKATGLDEKGREALEAAAPQAVEQAMGKSEGRLDELMRNQFKQIPPGQVGIVLAELSSQIPMITKWSESLGGALPTDQQAWADALKKTLTPGQLAAWESAQAKHKEEVEDEIGGFLKSLSTFASAQERSEFEQKASDVLAALNLPKDRADKVNALAESVIAGAGEAARSRAENALLAMGDNERKDVVSGRQNIYEWSQPGFNEVQPDPEWDAGLEKLLTPKELNLMQTAGEDRRSRLESVMGEMMVALLDQKIAFTEAQRQQLQPIAQRLARKLADNAPTQGLNSFNSYNSSEFYQAAADAPEDQVKAILDPIQWGHWQEVTQMKDGSEDSVQYQAGELPPPDDKPHPAYDPEVVENEISDYLAEKCGAERRTIMAGRILKAEDAARVAHLPVDAADRLQSAARGAAEEFLTQWEGGLEQMVRAKLDNPTPDTIKEQLSGIQEYMYMQLQEQASNMGAGKPTVWATTLKSTLTPAQQDAWQKERDARKAYLQRAIVDLIVAAFSQKVGLSENQVARLEPEVETITRDYGRDIDNMFRSAVPSEPWYLQGYIMFLPVAGIPDQHLKSILTDVQSREWKGSGECSNATNYWQNIVQTHMQIGNRRGRDDDE
ncbi:MAG: PDZ domain-containing protein [Chthoniobacteraceae bacterium]|jgi:hypothetical protein